MLSNFLGSAGAAQDNKDKPPRRTSPGYKGSKKLHEGNKKTSEKLAQVKNLYYLCIKQKR